MNKIEVMLLNPLAIEEAERMMVCTARMTQRGHKIHGLNDFADLYQKDYTPATVKAMVSLPHPTIQKFSAINVVVSGASRRFLAQITRHQNEVKFMSASLQYSDYSGQADYVIPYHILGTDMEESFLSQCETAMQEYARMVEAGIDNDSAGYMAPQSLRNVLVISATPYQWKHMIRQRICRRNTPETRYVLLKIWEQLYAKSPALFSDCGPFCMREKCEEGKMACGKLINKGVTPTDILKADFPKLYE